VSADLGHSRLIALSTSVINFSTCSICLKHAEYRRASLIFVVNSTSSTHFFWPPSTVATTCAVKYGSAQTETSLNFAKTPSGFDGFIFGEQLPTRGPVFPLNTVALRSAHSMVYRRLVVAMCRRWLSMILLPSAPAMIKPAALRNAESALTCFSSPDSVWTSSDDEAMQGHSHCRFGHSQFLGSTGRLPRCESSVEGPNRSSGHGIAMAEQIGLGQFLRHRRASRRPANKNDGGTTVGGEAPSAPHRRDRTPVRLVFQLYINPCDFRIRLSPSHFIFGASHNTVTLVIPASSCLHPRNPRAFPSPLLPHYSAPSSISAFTTAE
jgi:hypothetical protein